MRYLLQGQLISLYLKVTSTLKSSSHIEIEPSLRMDNTLFIPHHWIGLCRHCVLIILAAVIVPGFLFWTLETYPLVISMCQTSENLYVNTLET